MTNYVVGFVFTPDFNEVLLVRKERPRWQQGKLNGIGGKVEPGETPREAMSRECREECGVAVDSAAWECVVVLNGTDKGGERAGAIPDDFAITFYRATVTFEVFEQASSMTDEGIEPHTARHVSSRRDVMPNLRWIVPLVIDPCIVLPICVTDAPSREVKR